MLVDLDELNFETANGWLTRRRHPEADLWIYNYSAKTQYENHWTDLTRMCRGLIVEADGFVKARPYPKFFNLGDPNGGHLLDEPFVVKTKMDGSLGIGYMLDGRPQIATRGRFDSEQAVEANRMLEDIECKRWGPDVTPLFEIIYPENRIVVDYGDTRDLYLLDVVERDTARPTSESFNGVLHLRDVWGGNIVWPLEINDLEGLSGEDALNEEGYVVTFQSGHRVKIKFPTYLKIHKVRSNLSERSIWAALKDGTWQADRLLLPDEFHLWADSVAERLQGKFDGLKSAYGRIVNDRPAGTRKEVAAFFNSLDVNAGILFGLLDGKDCDEEIWDLCKPDSGVGARMEAAA